MSDDSVTAAELDELQKRLTRRFRDEFGQLVSTAEVIRQREDASRALAVLRRERDGYKLALVVATEDNAKKDAALRDAISVAQKLDELTPLGLDMVARWEAALTASQEAPASPAADHAATWEEACALAKRPASPLPGLTREQRLAGYEVATKFGVLEKSAFDLTDEMQRAFVAASPSPGLCRVDPNSDQTLRAAVIEECAKVADKLYLAKHAAAALRALAHREGDR